MVKNNTINASYYDDFDDPFAPSDDSNINIPAHDDWNGLPWTEEPYDYDNPFDHNKDYNAAVLPVESMPDITPEEKEICKELSRITSNNRDTTSDNKDSCTNDTVSDDFDDDMSLFDDNPPPPDDYNGGDSDTVSSAKSEKKKCPKYVVEVKDENGDIEKVFINRNELLKHVLDHNEVMMIQNHTTNMVMLYAYIDGRYVYLTDVSVERMVAKYITDYDLDLLKMADVFDVAKKLAIVAPEESLDKINADENIINFKNGVLNLSTGDMHPHSPHFLSTIQIPCDYNPKLAVNLEKNAPVFNSYLDTLCNNDCEVKKLICQYMALVISNIRGSRLKKAMIFYGPGDTGKSKIIELLQNLLGDDHCTVCDISDLEKRFTTSNLYGKRLAGSSDMTFATISEVKIFKNLTGGDKIFSEKKCKDGFHFKFDGFFLFGANVLPRFGGDRGDWVYERFFVIPCNNVIPVEKRDRSLIDKMVAEREAIVAYLVSLLPEIIKNGYNLHVPKVCKDALETFKEQNSPVIQFYKQFCKVRDLRPTYGDKLTGKSIYDAYVNWIKSTNMSKHVTSYKDFIAEIANYINIPAEDMMIRTSYGRYLQITAKPEFISDGFINITY